MSETVTVEIQRQKLKWYIQLLKQLQTLIGKRDRVDLEVKHEIGALIIREKPNIKEPMSRFVQQLSNDLDYSSREIWYCIKFAETYPTMNHLLKDFAKSKGVSPETVSIQDLPAWREIRNFVLLKGFDVPQQDQETSKPPEELKKCEMEQIVSDLLTSLTPLRAETLKCEDCEIRDRCFQVKTKILTVGQQLIGGLD